MSKCYIGWDNGVGTLGVVYDDDRNGEMIMTPISKKQNYTKQKGMVSRLDYKKVKEFLSLKLENCSKVFCRLERPLVNPTRFKASVTGIRILEGQESVLEELTIPYEFIDSKEWQKVMLPKGTTGAEALKQASKLVGKRLFPHIELLDKKSVKDADGILIAEYMRRKELN